MKGWGSGRRSDSTVTAPSFIASSSADCVLGVARLISSASTMLAKMGPAWNSKRSRRRVEDGDPEHVGRQRVAGELDPPELQRETAPERPRERRLADARHVLDQDVPAREQRRQDQVHGSRVAPVDQPDVVPQAGQAARDLRLHAIAFMPTPHAGCDAGSGLLVKRHMVGVKFSVFTNFLRNVPGAIRLSARLASGSWRTVESERDSNERSAGPGSPEPPSSPASWCLRVWPGVRRRLAALLPCRREAPGRRWG